MDEIQTLVFKLLKFVEPNQLKQVEEFLKDMKESEIQRILVFNKYNLFFQAFHKGNLDLMKLLFKYANEETKKTVLDDSVILTYVNNIFESKTYLEFIELLLDNASEVVQKQKIIECGRYKAFRIACSLDNKEAIKKIFYAANQNNKIAGFMALDCSVIKRLKKQELQFQYFMYKLVYNIDHLRVLVLSSIDESLQPQILVAKILEDRLGIDVLEVLVKVLSQGVTIKKIEEIIIFYEPSLKLFQGSAMSYEDFVSLVKFSNLRKAQDLSASFRGSVQSGYPNEMIAEILNRALKVDVRKTYAALSAGK